MNTNSSNKRGGLNIILWLSTLIILGVPVGAFYTAWGAWAAAFWLVAGCLVFLLYTTAVVFAVALGVKKNE